jgi:hypothetical protein
MDNIFINAAIISVIFLLGKFAEVRLLNKEENKPMSDLLRDTLIVYLSVLIGSYVAEQFQLSSVSSSVGKATQAFTGAPEF